VDISIVSVALVENFFKTPASSLQFMSSLFVYAATDLLMPELVCSTSWPTSCLAA
jgi:hypothetical protein